MNFQQRKFYISITFPLFFVLLLWLIKIAEFVLQADFSNVGIFPLKIQGLFGVIAAPLIHGSFSHLMANTIPLLILGTGLFYFYNRVAFRVFFFIYFLTGIWVWFGARHSYHIGSSGIVYGLAFFIFTSGVILKDIRLLAISLLVVFLYGGIIWDILPLRQDISWESHLAGSVAGVILAFYYRNEIPVSKKPDWLDDDDSDDDETTDLEPPNDYFSTPTPSSSKYKIRYSNKDK